MALRKTTADNIMVCVRVRPFNTREKENNYARCIDMPSTRHVAITDENGIKKEFEFDRAYWSHDQDNYDAGFATQETLYEELGANLIENAMVGYNNCLFAYGQTGSGKSHSVLGAIRSPESRGLLPRVVEGLFEQFAQVTRDGGKVKCEVSFLEIYSEKLKDLLSAETPGKNDKPLEVKTNQEEGSHVPGLTRIEVFNADEVLTIIEDGVNRREVGATDMNATSSRSHCIFTFRMNMEIMKMGVKKTFKSQTHLVDLAGSERAEKTGAVGKRLQEGIAINSSLTTLARVISALAAQAEGKKTQIPPFRESKLTALLKDSLTGNSKTVMMAALSPAMDSYEETFGTLMFAKNVKAIKTNAVSNVKSTGAGGAAHLQAQIDNLASILQSLGINAEESTAGNIVMAEAENGESPRNALAFKEQGEEVAKLMEELNTQKQMLVKYQEKFGDATAPSAGKIQTSSKEIKYRPNDDTKMQPYLINVSEDPLRTGALMYFLLRDETMHVGSHSSSHIKLDGGALPFVCAIRNMHDVDIQLSTTKPDTFDDRDTTKSRSDKSKRRIVIEKYGGSVKETVGDDATIEMSHNDVIHFSSSCRFRLILPFSAMRRRMPRSIRAGGPVDLRATPVTSISHRNSEEEFFSDDEDEDEGFEEKQKQHAEITEHVPINVGSNLMQLLDSYVEIGSSEYNAAQLYFEDLGRRLNPKRLLAFMAQVTRVFPLVKEANQITQKIRPADKLNFSIGLVTDVFSYNSEEPAITVRMWREKRTGATLWRHIVREKIYKRHVRDVVNRIFGDKSHKDSEIVAEFNLWEFRRRLNLMRQVMNLAMDDGLVHARNFMSQNVLGNDPWFYCDIEKNMKLSSEILAMMRMVDDSNAKYNNQIASLTKSYDAANNEVKECQRQSNAFKRSCDEKTRELQKKEREIQEKLRFLQSTRERAAMEMQEVRKAENEKYQALEVELAREAEKRFEAQTQLRQEKEMWIERLRTGEALLKPQHEQLMAEGVQDAIIDEMRKYMSLEEHDRKMAQVSIQNAELQKHNQRLKEAISRDYVPRLEHKKEVENLQRQIKGWTARALEAVDKEHLAETRYRKAIMNNELGLRENPSSVLDSTPTEARTGRFRLQLEGVDEESLSIFSKIQADVNEIMEGMDMVQGKMGKVSNALHS